MIRRIRSGAHLVFAFLVGLSASYVGITQAESAGAQVAQATRTPITVSLRAGDRLTVSCAGRLVGTLGQISCEPVATATASPTRTRTAVPATSTRTARPSRTPTPLRSATPTRPAATPTRTSTPTPPPAATPTATWTSAAPTAPPPSGTFYEAQAVAPEILGTCSADVHNRFVALGPDGYTYRTWHPQTVPVDPARPELGTCTFAHEHGADPATSQLQGAEPIVFDYVARIAELNGMPMPEAHEGFKVHVANAGQLNDEYRISRVTALMLYHMGTGGVRRYLAPMHTLAVQAQMPDGSRVNVRGMADTESAGSICAREYGDITVGRAVMTLPNVPETANGRQPCVVQSAYEIWQFSLSITRNRSGEDPLLIFNSSLAAFDPITAMDPADVTRVVYSSDVFPNWNGGYWRGCNREFYVGSAVLRNNVGTPIWTDAHGNVLSGTHTAADALLQVMPRGNVFDPSSPASSWQVLAAWRDGSGAGTQFKLQQPTCAPGLGLRN